MASDCSPLPDEVAEADEMDQNAGKKGLVHDDPGDPPRRRANKVRGHGTFGGDRPSVAGVVGRGSGKLQLVVVERSDRATLEEQVARWVADRNASRCRVNWQFTTADARVKLKRLYPSFHD